MKDSLSTEALITLIHNYVTLILPEEFNNRNELLSYIRKHIFIPRQKIEVITVWFNFLSYIELTNDELDILKDIVIKNKIIYWDILTYIIENQKQMSEKKLLLWFKDININADGNRKYTFFAIIKDKRIEDENLKVRLFTNLLNDDDYKIDAVDMLDEEIIYNEPIWNKLLYVLVDIINTSTENAKELAKYWAEHTLNFNILTNNMNIVSPLLYSYTGLNQYMPLIVQDVFIF